MSAEHGGYVKGSASSSNGLPTTSQIERITTAENFNESPAHNEKLYLDPEHPVAGQLRRTFANPTPVALAGFLMCASPAAFELMGWRGAGGGTGNTAATTADYYFFGGLLFILGGVGEFILGNTFTCVIFNTFGAFWFTFGGTLTPYYNAIHAYDEAAGFYASFAYFLIFMGVLCTCYLIGAIRTNICLCIILCSFVFAFGFLSAAYFYSAAGHATTAHRLTVGGGGCVFVSLFPGWYLWLSMIFEAVDFPVSIPVGDLSTYIKGKHEKELAKRRAALNQV